MTAILRCEECGAEAFDGTRGWRAVHARVPDEDEHPVLVIYCPVCAERECEYRPRTERPAELDG